MQRDYPVTDPEKRRKYEQELEQLQKFANTESTNPDYNISVAINHLYLGNFAQATNSITAALLVKPDYFLAWHMLGAIYFDRGMYNEAYIAFSNASDNWENESEKDKYLHLAQKVLDDIAESLQLANKYKKEVENVYSTKS